MSEMVGRFYVQRLGKNDDRGAILIGVGDMATLPEGHVLEIQQAPDGSLSVNDLGKAQIADDQNFKDISIDTLLGKAHGRHLMPDGED